MSRLKNKTAIVTGAAHGIGKAIAEVFAEEGATVFVADLDANAGTETVAELQQRGGNAVFVPCDVSSREQVERVVNEAAKKSGRLDILCNNAAFIGQWHNAGEAPQDEWEKCFRVSLMGTQFFTQEAL